jgi:F-type H+-transporting ATPase subunit b
MEQTIQALGGILLKAVPTIVILILLHFYFKAMLFGPLDKVLKQREQLTSGAKKVAEETLASTERKAEEYEVKFREARAEVYKQQEETRKQWLQDQAGQLAQAHTNQETAVKAAKQSISVEASAARQNLVETSSVLAGEIAKAVLSGSAR